MRILLRNLLAAVLLFCPLMAFTADANFRCHGRVYDSDFFFKYELELHDQGTSRIRLITYSGYNDSMDYGWKEFTYTGGKMAVDSPFHQYSAFISPMNHSYELILVDPVTSVPVQNPPYNRFVCVNPL